MGMFVYVFVCRDKWALTNQNALNTSSCTDQNRKNKAYGFTKLELINQNALNTSSVTDQDRKKKLMGLTHEKNICVRVSAANERIIAVIAKIT